MRRIASLSCLYFCFILAVLGAPPAPAETTHPFSVQDLLAMKRISDPQASPDGRSVIFTVWRADLEANKGRKSIYAADMDGRHVRPLTGPDADAANPRWSPDGKWIYFLAPDAGVQQVWRMPWSGGMARVLTKLPLDVETMEVAPTGSFLILSMSVYPGKTPAETRTAFLKKEKSKASGMVFDRLMVRNWDRWADGTRSHLFIYRLPSGPVRDLMPAMDADCPSRPWGGSEEFTLSPDGKTVVFSAKDVGREEAWSTNTDLFALSTEKPAFPVRLTTNPAADGQPRFSPDGARLAYLAQKQPGNEADRFHLVIRDMATGEERTLALAADESPQGDRNPDNLVWSADGKTIFCTADYLGQHALFAVDVDSGKSRLVMKTGMTEAPRPLSDGRILFIWSSLFRPAELYLLADAGGESGRVTRMNDNRIAAVRFGKTETFAFPGAKGETVHGRIVYPADFVDKQKYPAVLIVHGGPQGSNLNEFHYRWNPQIFAGAGYAVILIDYHGSTGYGRAFTDSIRKDWGGAPYEDLMRGLDFALDKYPFVDRDRIGAVGPSYGGYMVNWLAGRSDRFKCLISHAGIFNRQSAYYEMDTLWFADWEFGPIPMQGLDFDKKFNPADEVKNWRTPMLVITGERDYRVSYSQGLSAFTALQRLGIPSRLLVFPDEGHWVLKPANVLLWHETVLAWLDQWLKGETKP